MNADTAAPVIVRVADGNGLSLTNPGTTSDTVLILSGTPSGVMIILDNGAIIGSASAKSDGTWQIPLTAALGRHSDTVRSDGEPTSAAWIIDVVAAAVKPVITKAGGSVQTGFLKTAAPNGPIGEIFSLAAPCVSCELTVDTIGTMIDNLVWE